MLNARFFCAQASLVLAFSFSVNAQTPAPGAAPVPEMKVAAHTLRVRTLNGEHFCSLPQGTKVQPIGITEDGERLRVSLGHAPNCRPDTGYVDVRYLRPATIAGYEMYEEAKVDTDGLSLRSSARVDEDSFKCSLRKGTKVDILPEEHRGSTTSFLKIKLQTPIAGCPADGWVSASYLRPALDMDGLPVIHEDPRHRSESCTDCELARGQSPARGTDATADVARTIETRARATAQGQSPFLQALGAIKANRGRCVRQSAYACNRGLIQMPLIGKNAGFCGSNHYNPDTPIGVDTYAAPHTACALAALAQEWKKTACPSGGGCRFSWGDISHKTRPRWNGHVSHTDGECIDIRPLNSGEFSNTGRTWKSRGYDRAKTRDLLAMAKKMGATSVFFNDKQLRREGRSSYSSGHDNHIHICFKNTKTVQATCNNLKVDPAVCPELQ